MTTIDAGGTMSDERRPYETPPAGGKRPHGHHDDRGAWPHPDRSGKAPAPVHSGKTMHHPAFRIGEIKHGKS